MCLAIPGNLLIPHRTLQKFWTNTSLAKLGFGTALCRQLGCHSLSFAKSRFNYCRVSLNNSPSDWKHWLWVYHVETGIHGENTSTLQIECQFNFIFWSQTWPSNDDRQTLFPQLRRFCSLLFHSGRMPFASKYCSERCVDNNKCNINENTILMYSGNAIIRNITALLTLQQ
jgi:hypothetical protein